MMGNGTETGDRFRDEELRLMRSIEAKLKTLTDLTASRDLEDRRDRRRRLEREYRAVNWARDVLPMAADFGGVPKWVTQLIKGRLDQELAALERALGGPGKGVVS